MPWVYIMASKPRGTLYIGSTSDLVRRVREHRSGRGSSFTRRYDVGMLVWYRAFTTVEEAGQRERTMKEWPREWKINIIECENPHWSDLGAALVAKARKCGV